MALNLKRDFDPHDYVEVVNGYPGQLVYRSKKTGEETIWDEYLDVQELELQELKNAKASAKTFFNAHWFIIDPDVQAWLGVTKQYENWRSDEEIVHMCKGDPSKIINYIDSLTGDQRDTFLSRLCKLISGGAIDSRNVIKALKEKLHFDLIDE